MIIANDVLCLTLYNTEENKEDIPTPSHPLKIKVQDNEFLSLAGCDTLQYRKLYDNRTVKKTFEFTK
ncbi:hypothetical protein [Alkaliphilus oremlandii]|uniref:hypothetical protein n=1 Tax=Alkaliphilus oremlandii TaxID=461876 RepID=UPI0018DE4959|nr:hypothetical protein [Alkaliphilus oremlandii]